MRRFRDVSKSCGCFCMTCMMCHEQSHSTGALVTACRAKLQADAKMLTASGDQCVHLWDTASAQGLGQFRGHNGSVKSVCPSPDGQPTFASGQAPDRPQQDGSPGDGAHHTQSRIAEVPVHLMPSLPSAGDALSGARKQG